MDEFVKAVFVFNVTVLSLVFLVWCVIRRDQHRRHVVYLNALNRISSAVSIEGRRTRQLLEWQEARRLRIYAREAKLRLQVMHGDAQAAIDVNRILDDKDAGYEEIPDEEIDVAIMEMSATSREKGTWV